LFEVTTQQVGNRPDERSDLRKVIVGHSGESIPEFLSVISIWRHFGC
jgi:hypothetical protein